MLSGRPTSGMTHLRHLARNGDDDFCVFKGEIDLPRIRCAHREQSPKSNGPTARNDNATDRGTNRLPCPAFTVQERLERGHTGLNVQVPVPGELEDQSLEEGDE